MRSGGGHVEKRKRAWLASDLATFRSIGWRDRWLLARTSLVLAAASLAVRFVPFRRLMESLRPVDRRPLEESEARTEIERVHWAIEACARRLPWRIVCFQKGLAAHHLLRLRGIPTSLHYGIDNGRLEGLRAHVWVTSATGPVIGAEIADEFVRVASFPPSG